MRALMLVGAGVLSLLALSACGQGPNPEAQTPKNNAVVRSVTTMTGSIDRARDAAGAMNQRSAESAAAADALQ